MAIKIMKGLGEGGRVVEEINKKIHQNLVYSISKTYEAVL